MKSPRRTAAGPARPRTSESSLNRTRPHALPGKVVVQYATLPRSHLNILGTEAELFGVSRSEFLVMLLRRRHGRLSFDRPERAPRYRFDRKEVTENERYGWYLPHADRRILHEDCLRMGNITVSTWIVVTLNDWIGQPGGLL